MTGVAAAGQRKHCSVELIHADRRVCLTAALGEPYTGGSIVTAFPDAVIVVEPAEEASREYPISTWVSGLASGALYAFRSLQVPRRRVWLSEFQGRLGRDDMGAVATAATLLVAQLSDKDAPRIGLADWSISAGDIRSAAESARIQETQGAVALMPSGAAAQKVPPSLGDAETGTQVGCLDQKKVSGTDISTPK